MNIDSTTPFPYPPPILVKHHIWFFEDADLFISIRGIAFGLYRNFFEPSPFFQRKFKRILPGYTVPQGTTCLLPIPFDNLTYLEFSTFLMFLYRPDNFLGTKDEWFMIRRRCIKWKFTHQAGLALHHLVNLRRSKVPINHPILRNQGTMYRWMEEKERRWRCPSGSRADDDTESEEEEEIEDESEEEEVEDKLEDENREFLEDEIDEEIIYYSDDEDESNDEDREFIEDELA